MDVTWFFLFSVVFHYVDVVRDEKGWMIIFTVLRSFGLSKFRKYYLKEGVLSRLHPFSPLYSPLLYERLVQKIE